MRNKFLISFIFVIAVVLRLYNLDAYGIWFDEKGNILSANGIVLNKNFSEKAAFTNVDFKSNNTRKNVIKANNITDSGNSILYVILLHFWSQIFSNSDFATRLLSVILNLATLLILFKLSKRLTSSTPIAILSLLLFAFQQQFIEFSHEIRAYCLSLFLVVLSSHFMFNILLDPITTNRNKKSLFLYASFSLLAILSHYLTIYIIITQSILLLIHLIKQKKSVIYFISIHLLVVGLFALWMIYFGWDGYKYMSKRNADIANRIIASETGSENELLKVTFINYFKAVIQWFSIILNCFLQEAGLRIRHYWPNIFLHFVPLFFAIKKNKISKQIKWILILLILSSLVFNSFSAISADHLTSFFPKYSIFSIPYATLLLSIGLVRAWEQPGKFSKILSASITLSILICMSVNYYFTIYSNKKNFHFYPNGRSKNPYYTIAKKIEKEYCQKDTIIIASWTDASLINLYIGKQLYIQKIDSTIIHKVLIKHDTLTKNIFTFEGNNKFN